MAYEIGYDIVIDDDKCRSICNEYQKRADKFEENLAKYLQILGRIKSEAIMEGSVSEKIGALQECAEVLKGESVTLANEAKTLNSSFLSDFDTADNYIF